MGDRHHPAGIGRGNQQNPFTVTYKFQPEASWTDNAPITADDFWYLWRQMVSQPGVVDPAGYDLITGVQSIEGGKTAVVTFSQPYPAWRELFTDILPAHIVKDVPGGFGAGLARAMPVTGGSSGWRTSIRSATRYCSPATTGTGVSPPSPIRSCSAAAGAPAALADSIRNGDTQVAQVHGSGAAFAQLSAIPRCARRVDTPRVLQLSLRAEQPAAHRPAGAQGAPGSARRRTAGLGRFRQRQHRDTRSGAGPLTVRSRLPAHRAAAPHPAGCAGTAAPGTIDTDVTPVPTPVPPNGRHGRAAPHTTRGRISRDGQQLAW